MSFVAFSSVQFNEEGRWGGGGGKSESIKSVHKNDGILKTASVDYIPCFLLSFPMLVSLFTILPLHLDIWRGQHFLGDPTDKVVISNRQDKKENKKPSDANCCSAVSSSFARLPPSLPRHQVHSSAFREHPRALATKRLSRITIANRHSNFV